MRLGLFGGTFDPVHFGHLLLAECCREQCALDRVVFLPTAVSPHKQGRNPTPAAERIAMLELATGGHAALEVSSYEVDRGGVSYTVETLRHFRESEPDARLFFLLGADMLNDLPHWREASAVIELALPVVVRRPDAEAVDFDCLASIASAERIEAVRSHQVEMPPIGISSTAIRRQASRGRSIRYLTSRAVEKYIETNRPYR